MKLRKDGGLYQGKELNFQECKIIINICIKLKYFFIFLSKYNTKRN